MTESESGAATESYHLVLTGSGLSLERDVDQAIAAAVFQLVLGGGIVPQAGGGDPRIDLDAPGGSTGPRAKKKAAAKKTAAKKAGGKKLNYSATKDINFAPNGKKAWKAFAAEKNSTNNFQKALVAVYYMRETLGRMVPTGDVIAAFNAVGWKNPKDPANNLQPD